MKNLPIGLDLVIKIIFLASVIFLFTLGYFLNKDIKEIKSQLTATQGNKPVSIPTDDIWGDGSFTEEELGTDLLKQESELSCPDLSIEDIDQMISEAIAGIPTQALTAQTVVKETSVPAGSTVYIPLGGVTVMETSTDWVDVKGTETWIDAVNDYGANAIFSWEAFLKVKHGNGQAFARIYDDTNKIAVLGSELSTINNETYQLVTSGNLNLWAGNNLYKVQVKSLNSFEITYSGGRLKVTY